LLEELRSLHAARDRFFASVNHELRNAVTAVHGWAEMLIREVGATPPRTAHEILDSAEYTLGLLDDLLDLSRIDEAKLHLNMGRTNARTLVSDAMQIVQPTADKAGIRLEVTGAGSDLYCRTDATRVRQILVNLLLNAVRHSPQNATVTVDVHGNGSELAFAVVDQGKGIERDELATIFDAYSTTDSPGAGGAGLGLTLSQQLARLLGGDIKVESEVGQGTRFVVSLRCWEEEPEK
jgi:signal transduction histidine kinase